MDIKLSESFWKFKGILSSSCFNIQSTILLCLWFLLRPLTTPVFLTYFYYSMKNSDQKYLESFEMLCWRRMEKISWTDHVRNEEVLLRVNEQRNILHEIRKRKANWIGHILRRNCLLKQVIEGKIKGEMEVAKGRGRRRKKLLDDLRNRIGHSHLKEEALDRTMWKHRFGGGFGPVVRQITEWINESNKSCYIHTAIWSQCLTLHKNTRCSNK